jgi:hypothetical protein
MSAAICLPGNSEDTDWQEIYEHVIPPIERVPVSRLVEGLANNLRLLHVTRIDGEAITFSIVHLGIENIHWLSYFGTRPEKQSEGWGAKHINELIRLLKHQYPNRLGLFGDIRSPYQNETTPSESKNRQRREEFYGRLGACSLISYPVPALVPGEPLEQHMMCIPFQGQSFDEHFLDSIKGQVLKKLYLVNSPTA